MLIQEIFERKIDRHINAAVVVGDNKKIVIEAEITEYVFTRDLVNNLYKVLDSILNGKNGKAGIWINGYYGSGKSHFLKYVNYCLHPEYKEKALVHLEEAMSGITMNIDDTTPAQIKKLRSQLDKQEIDAILFNVDNVSGDQTNERITRIFLNQFNKYRGYNSSNIPLARLLEKQLDKESKFGEFKQKLKEKKFDWEKDPDTISRLRLDTVLSVAAEVMPGISIDVLKTALKDPSTYHISIDDTLIPEFKEWLAGKNSNYRLVFLVDEVSQYVGQNKELLLNLQTIVEMVSEYLNNNVWIACTAQQGLAEVVQGVDSADHRDEFGKILGRFDTRISLESNDPTYITQKRVLDKNANGQKTLTKLYKENKDAIEHQFNIGSSIYRGFNNEDDFLLSYPFAPYQFKLIGDVLDAFQQLRFVITQVKDNARSVIGLTHFTAKKYAQKEVGTFVPFDAFLNDQLRQNMQNAGARALDRPLSLAWIKKESFEERIVKNLFMVSNLSHSVIQTFPPTVENLTILMMTKLDENKLDLQKKIKDVISKLKEENVIREEEGRFFFYNEDEIDVTNLIRNRHVNAEQKFTELDTTFFRKILKIEPKFSVEKNDFHLKYWLDDKEVFRNGDIRITLHVLDDQPLDAKNLQAPADELIIGVNEWFNKDQQLRKDFEWYCKTKAYLQSSGAAATGERKKSNENFALRNKQLEYSITSRIIQQFGKTRFISQQTIVESSEINGSIPRDRYANALEKHLLAVYNRLSWANNYAYTEQDLRAATRNPQIPTPELSAAENIVNDFISSNGNKASVEELVNKFDKRPFGWKHTQVIHILIMLQKKKKREFEYLNEPRFPAVDFVEKAINSRERSRCIVSSAEEISAEDIDNTLAAFREIFNRDIAHTTDGNKLFDEVNDWLKQYKHGIQQNLDSFYGKAPFGVHLHHYDEMLHNWLQIRDPQALFRALIIEKDAAKVTHDHAKATQDFITRMYPEYEKIRQFVQDNQSNFAQLSEENIAKSRELIEWLQNDSPQTGFRHKRKLMDELKKAITDFIVVLHQKSIDRYNTIFDELENEAGSRRVNRLTSLPDRGTKLQEIKSSNSISQLQLLKANAASYKSNLLEKILRQQAERIAEENRANGGPDREAAEPVPFYISRVKASITNETELNEFLEKLETDMLKLLQENKTIIIKE